MSWRFTEAQTDALSCVALLWSTSLDGEVTDPNPSWERFTGQSLQGYSGSGWLDAVHPEDRDAAMDAWRRSVHSRERLTTSYRLRRRDGEYRLMAVVGTLVEEGGVPSGWIGSCQDMTDAHRNEQALQRSEERFRFLDELGQATRTVVDASEVMGLTARLLGQYLGAHRCAYADVEPDGDSFTIRADWSGPGMASSVGVYSLALFGSKAVHNLHHGRFLIVQDVDRELGDDDGGRMFNAIGIRAIVCAPLVKSGRLVAMMAVHHATPRAWNGRELTLIGEVVDRCWAHIERVRTAALLREQDKRKDEFLATLAHELRNPLAPMRYALAALDRVPPGSSQAVQAQQVIDRQVHMMTRLVDDLLDLSRVNRGLIELRKERVDLREVLEHAAEACQGTLRAAGHELQLSLPPSPVSVDGDRDRLAQVVDNLLSNAAKYTPQGGQIRLAAWTAGTQSFIEVRDNGIGIPPEEQGKLFQIFTQLPHTARRSQGGLGIGLSLVKTLVQMHGGIVRVESAGLDQGSAFTVQLPLAAVPSDLSLPGGPTTSGKQGAVRVLVVEDNPDGRQSLVILLGLMGHQVASASDGAEGLDVALQFRPDVALLDLGLPKMDGLTLAMAMRDHPQLARVTLVALTGWGTDKDRARTKAAGFDQHFTKPVDPDALEALLAGLTAPPRHPSV